ncbi:MAG: phosphopantothenoylcysteine decarboxylase [Phycisphaeraceae bacterium]
MTTNPPRFLVTAGNTRERIDQVRDWGNIFTGNTGFDIARALAALGEVDLLTSNRQHLAQIDAGLGLPHQVRGHAFTAHGELRTALAALLKTQQYHAIFMTAAIADYKPAGVFSVLSREKTETKGEEIWRVKDVQAGKVKSNHPAIAVLGTRTEKLIDLFRGEWGYRGLLVKFKLEVGPTREELVRIGQASRVASGADYLVANTLDMVGGDKPGAILLSDKGEEWIARAALAQRLARLAANHPEGV